MKCVLTILALVVAASVVVLIAFIANQPDSGLVARRSEFVGKLHDAGLLVKKDCTRHEAQVSLRHWLALDADGKRNITSALAVGCGDQGATTRIRIIDVQSGRKLAEHNGGYEVF